MLGVSFYGKVHTLSSVLVCAGVSNCKRVSMLCLVSELINQLLLGLRTYVCDSIRLWLNLVAMDVC